MGQGRGVQTHSHTCGQVRVMNQAGETKAVWDTGILTQVTKLMAEDGGRGFFAGAMVRTGWMMVGGVIYWLVLEQTQVRG